ncbi:MAG: ISKra4 family transposase, partial [Streptosporangiaceae bacterium]
FYAARKPGPSPGGTLLVMQFDGKGIVMRPEALREATAKAAAGRQRKLATRLSPGEKNGRKRMAELGCVHDCEPVPRTPADIISRPGTKDAGRARSRKDAPEASGKWLTASVTDEIPAVIAAGFDEAERRDPAHERTWIALVDGNKQQIEAIEAEAAARGVTITILIDFIHVLEYTWKAAWSFFETGNPAAEEWVAGQALKILQGKAAQVAAGVRRRATTYGYSARERDGADTCASYLTAKKHYLGYDTALASGWPIATGIIEGACRHIVKDRMDITGARWGLDGAEAILKLRALNSNGDLDAYWQWHLEQEQQRVHYARYQDPSFLAA